MAFTYTTASNASGFTQAQLVTFIDDRMVTGLGYTQADSYTSGSDFRVYSYATNGTTKGTFIVRVEVSATQVILTSYDTWNSGTHTGTGTSSTTSLSWSNASGLTADIFSGTEGRFFVLGNNSNRLAIGYLKCSTINTTTWPESRYRHAMLPAGSNLGTFYTSTGINSTMSMNAVNLTSVGAVTWAGSKRQVWGPKVVYSSASGYAGFFTDVLETGLSGIAYGDIIQVTAGVEEYFVIGASGNACVLRTV